MITPHKGCRARQVKRRLDGGDAPDLTNPKWVGIQLVGGGGNNRSAIGARVTVVSGDLELTKVVDGGSGRGRQHPSTLVFGVGASIDPIFVTIRWPNGYVQEPSGSLVPGYYYTIEDESSPVVLSGTEQFSYQPGPAGSTWIFDWDTTYNGDISMDAVVFSSRHVSGDPCYCYPDDTIASYGDPDVDVEVTLNPIVEGEPPTYHHRLLWHERCCVVGCGGYSFEATSGSTAGTTTSTEPVDFGPFRVCGKQSPNNPGQP